MPTIITNRVQCFLNTLIQLHRQGIVFFLAHARGFSLLHFHNTNFCLPIGRLTIAKKQMIHDVFFLLFVEANKKEG